CFPATIEHSAAYLHDDAILLVKARVERREDAPRLVAIEVSVPDVSQTPRGPVVITMQAQRCTPPMVDRLRDVLAAHPGATDVHLQLDNAGHSTVVRLGDGYRVAPTPALMAELKALLGQGAVGSTVSAPQ